ncbi:polymorphic toxin-type HINT domain-containing protein [Nocardiopsis composta]|uniref:Flp pilus assembly pilin Flp n=1 Tax=Nocardiopsis composta TaxID=157465 RepID=A0A7W8VFI8_9ACTN|nr:polymorphic toxin-type HINT domain-containing protein [Nocardiopsis composta]MBB5434606.1 Flp pilus assembly pilin Flp [Nocardiopsis composta]
MLRRIHDPERGASLTEYAAVVVLVASVIAAVMGIGIPDRVSTMLDHAFGTLDDPGAVSADGSSDTSNGGSDPAGDRTADEDSSAGGWNADDIPTPSSGGEASGAQPLPSLPTAAQPLGLGDPAGLTSGLHPGGAKVQQVGAQEWVDQGREQAWGFGQEMWDIGVQAWEGTKQAVEDPVGTAKETAKGVRDSLKDAATDTLDLLDGIAQDTLDAWNNDGFWAAATTFTLGHVDYWLLSAPFSPGGVLVPDEAREYWSEGEYGRAAAQVAANVVTYIPGLWGGKITRFLPDSKGPGSKGEGKEGSQQDKGEDKEDKDGITCASNSFLPGTPVLLADGTTTPIEDITPGDEVWAFDPRTGEEGPRKVTDTITGDGPKTLVDITTTDGSGTTGTITATDEHPFWAPEPAQWVDAADLEPGTWLRTSTGTWTQITATHTHQATDQQVHNLTIQDLHTYYVLAGERPLLAHNSNTPSDPTSFSNLIPEDTPQWFKPIAPSTTLLRSGNYAYVVTVDGELVIGKRTAGHVSLAQGRDVLAAGEFKTKGGKVVYLDNKSGHYRPYGAHAEKAAVDAFNENGLDADGKYIEAWRPDC